MDSYFLFCWNLFLASLITFSAVPRVTCIPVLISQQLTSLPSSFLQHSWEMVGKKKGVSGQKESGQTEPSEESKENRERDRDYSRRRGGPPRRGRGASRGRECMSPYFSRSCNYPGTGEDTSGTCTPPPTCARQCHRESGQACSALARPGNRCSVVR